MQGDANLVASGVHDTLNMRLHRFKINMCLCTLCNGETGGRALDMSDQDS